MLAKFSGLNPKGPYQRLEKEKKTLCVVLTYFIKWAREIRKFHVAFVQQRLRNVQKSVMHVQSCFFFCHWYKPNFFAIRRRRCKNSLLLWSRNFATMVTWRHTSLYICFVSPVPLGSIPELPAETCKEIKASEEQAVSGKYWLYTIKENIPVLAHCDMETFGKF